MSLPTFKITLDVPLDVASLFEAHAQSAARAGENVTAAQLMVRVLQNAVNPIHETRR